MSMAEHEHDRRGVVDSVPVRFRDRWIDDGGSIELTTTDGVRMRLVVAGTNDGAPTSASAALTITRVGDPAHASAVLINLDTGVIAQEIVSDGYANGARDLAWLRSRLDGELRLALRQRAERQRRADDIYDWMVGDRPRVALGASASFSQLLPAAWDLITTFRGKRYALLDTYRVDREAAAKSVALEIVDLAAGETVGHAEIILAQATRGQGQMWRCSGAITDALLGAFRQDADQWYGLVDHAEIVARIARVMGKWERDLRDPAGAVAELLRGSFDRDQTIEDRVKSLGPRCEPALHASLVGRDAGAAVKAARMLAEMGDDAGLGLLIDALADPDPERLDESDAWQIADAIQVLHERALEPLLAALAATSDRAAQDRLLDALIAIDVPDDRARDLMVDLVRAEPRRAGLLGDYGSDDPIVIDLLVELAREHIDRLRANLEDREAFDVAAELIQALRGLDEAREAIVQFDAIIEQRRRQAREAARRAAGLEASRSYPPRSVEPFHASARPGRNDPCWCGSSRKYKKCHLDADDAARLAP